MNTWFIVKVKYTKQLEDGCFKRVTESYLVAAVSFADAETRIYEELGSLIKGEFTVSGITRTVFHDIFGYEDAYEWFECKISYANIDADTEKAKKTTNVFLVTANSVKEADARIKESLSTLMVDFLITSIKKSSIVDVFPFKENEETK
jgi:hypothetical protein